MFYVMYPVFDTRKKKLKYEHGFLNISGTTNEIEKEIIKYFGNCSSFRYTVYPNKTSVEKKLAYYYQKLIKNGFTAPDKNGKNIRVKPANSKKDEAIRLKILLR